MTETTKYKPGPWTHDGDCVESNRGTVAETYGFDQEEMEANARLIASAPDLLAACKRAAAAVGSAASHGQYYSDAIEADLKAAIAKAEGTDA
jgi:hypothetical protein